MNKSKIVGEYLLSERMQKKFGVHQSQQTKARVLAKIPKAFCVKLDNGTGYVVWNGEGCDPRGSMNPAIGLGKTARAAWGSVTMA
jgi:hypothetical protein